MGIDLKIQVESVLLSVFTIFLSIKIEIILLSTANKTPHQVVTSYRPILPRPTNQGNAGGCESSSTKKNINPSSPSRRPGASA